MNLNWSDFTWGITDPSSAANGHLPLWARLLSFIVVIFPAIDVISVYPLIAITLGNNLAVSAHILRPLLPKKFHTLVWRAIASVPMIIVSLFVGDLATTMQFAGREAI